MVDIKEYFPNLYKDIKEIDTLVNIENEILSEGESKLNQAFYNTFILTADEQGITMFEKILNIYPNLELEDLEFRKQRVLLRLSMPAPFSIQYIRTKLDNILGKDSYELIVDYNNYGIELHSTAPNQLWYEEMKSLITWIKPANMTFTNIPVNYSYLKFSEEITAQKSDVGNYVLGEWELGKEPFISEYTSYTLKPQSIHSLTNIDSGFDKNFMSIARKEFINLIKEIYINDRFYPVTEFLIEISDNHATFFLDLPANTFADGITRITFTTDSNSEIYEYKVYIPNIDDIMIQLHFFMKEVLF